MGRELTTVYEFEGFRLDAARRRLSRGDEVVALTPKTFDTLLVLIRNRDRVLEKEEALRLLWPDVHVEESSLAQNVFALRRALGDSPEGARFVETVPRRGYRFIAEVRESSADAPDVAPTPGGRRPWVWAAAGLLAAAAIAAGAYVLGQRSIQRQEPEYLKLTFRRGFVRGAQFAPDGASAYFSASWDGQPPRIFVARPKNPEGQLLDLPEADLLSVSKRGELAILLRPPLLAAGIGSFGMLARVSQGGGVPKELLENVSGADWAPDGESLAVVRLVENRSRRVEYPIGNVVHETPPAACIGGPRVSPDGRYVAFVACKEDGGNSILIADRDRNVRRLARSLRWVSALAWGPSGDEIWYSVGSGSLFPELRAITLAGRDRLIARLPGTIEDVSADGSVLLTRGTSVWGIRGQAPGEKEERELTWLEGSVATDLSSDGRQVLFGEALEGGGINGRIYLRSTDGSPAVRLAEGYPGALSPDGRWALVKRPALADFTLLPIGAGESRELPIPDIRPYLALWFPDGKRLLIGGEVPGHPGRLWVQDLVGGTPRPLTPERTGVGALSPDGRLVATIGDDGHYVYPVDGGERRPLTGARADEWPVQWGDDGRVYVARQDQLPVEVTAVDPASGSRELWREIAPPDRAGIQSIRPLMTRDRRAYVYTYSRFLSDLYLVTGVR
jgi:DNA-binding winged helix-turn-helix (wHTH) protein/Tol biopolymer transport system component